MTKWLAVAVLVVLVVGAAWLAVTVALEVRVRRMQADVSKRLDEIADLMLSTRPTIAHFLGALMVLGAVATGCRSGSGTVAQLPEPSGGRTTLEAVLLGAFHQAEDRDVRGYLLALSESPDVDFETLFLAYIPKTNAVLMATPEARGRLLVCYFVNGETNMIEGLIVAAVDISSRQVRPVQVFPMGELSSSPASWGLMKMLMSREGKGMWIELSEMVEEWYLTDGINE